ncbi:hypothetical protein ACFE04_012075 [Oxalis oulophora]
MPSYKQQQSLGSEMKRQRRVAKYKSYAVESKMKNSIKCGFGWVKNNWQRCIEFASRTKLASYGSNSSRQFQEYDFDFADDQECSSSYMNSKRLLDFRHPSPISLLDPLISNESSNTSDSAGTGSFEGSKNCMLLHARKVLGLTLNPLKKLRSADVEMDSSDSGSSWGELDYVKEILSTLELTFDDLALGGDFINPCMFDQIERRKGGQASYDDNTIHRRKLLFDRVTEFLGLRYKQFSSGEYLNKLLAEEIYNEASNWKNVGDFTVDELVEQDMNCRYGRWMEFKEEIFAHGVDNIANRIFNSLIDEMIC